VGSVNYFSRDIDGIHDQGVQDLIETRVKEDAEAFRTRGDSVYQLALDMRRDAWIDAQKVRQSEHDSIYYTKGQWQRFQEHFIYGLGNSLIGYGGLYDWRVVTLQGEVLKAKYITVRPKNNRVPQAQSFSIGLMLLSETLGAYFLSILACILAVAATRKLEWLIPRIVIAVLVGFTFETWRNTGYATEVHAHATYTYEGVEIETGAAMHLLLMYLPIAGVCLMLWPSSGPDGDLASESTEAPSVPVGH
jgi:hypothetical protein